LDISTRNRQRRTLDEMACTTAHEIMVITGHQTLDEIERYTKAESRKKTADAAIAKLQA
jgi:hypothetical protein